MTRSLMTRVEEAYLRLFRIALLVLLTLVLVATVAMAVQGAMNAMTLHLARTLAPEVRVNAVCPGMITTRWFVDGVGQENFEKLKTQYEQTTPLARACTAEDVAEAIIWLVDGARTVTGETILLDSGLHLGKAVTVPARKAS